jgi:FKBP-type peptidyl-prolyl cis-trans isomerase 2
MQVGPNTVVTMDYTLRLDSGKVVDSSEGKEPLVFEYGQEQIIPGLERGLAGMRAGERKEIRVEAEEAYGSRLPDAVQEIPLDRFPEDIKPSVGLRLSVRGPQGEEVPFVISGVSDTHATLDFNHPLAGEPLTFAITVVDVKTGEGEERRIIIPGEA